MARPHHRKKHKAHVRQYKQSSELDTVPAGRTRASSMFAIVGALFGGAVGYFASQGNWIWIAVGFLAGTALGYLLGKRLD